MDSKCHWKISHHCCAFRTVAVAVAGKWSFWWVFTAWCSRVGKNAKTEACGLASHRTFVDDYVGNTTFTAASGDIICDIFHSCSAGFSPWGRTKIGSERPFLFDTPRGKEGAAAELKEAVTDVAAETGIPSLNQCSSVIVKPLWRWSEHCLLPVLERIHAE